MNQVPLDFSGPASALATVRTSRSAPRAAGGQGASVRLAPARSSGVVAAWRRWLRPHAESAARGERPAAPFATGGEAEGSQGPATFEAVGFEIGWDHAHHGIAPPPAHLHPGHPVRQGWEAGCACFGGRALKPTPAVRQWLALRLAAWTDGHSFDTLHVTPHLLTRLDTSHCPVTREVLTRGAGDAAQACVVRMDPGVGFRPGNLVVMGRTAVQARGTLGFHEAIARVERIEADGLAGLDGLGAAAWARLAVLHSFVTPLPHDEAARLPLLVLPPPRVPVVNPAQALQVLLTTQLMRAGYARRLADLAGRVTVPTARQALQVFMHTLLARRVALGANPDLLALRHGLEDAWRHPLVNQRWQAFARAMTPAACERLLRHGVAPGDAVQIAASDA